MVNKIWKEVTQFVGSTVLTVAPVVLMLWYFGAFKMVWMSDRLLCTYFR